MIKQVYRGLFIVLAIVLVGTVSVQAQLREDLPNRTTYTGPILKQNESSGTFANLFNMQMHQSYSMTFSSIGGQYQNINKFTNTMLFDFSDKLTGRVDVSLMHSPFGGAYNNMLYNGNTPAKIYIENAQLDYQISPNSRLSIQFHNSPTGYYNPWNPFNGYGVGGSSFYSPGRYPAH